MLRFPDMGPLAYSVIGAVLGANAATLVIGVSGQAAIRALRRKRNPLRSPAPLAQ